MRGFEIDDKKFRGSNLGREPAHLIREAIQNCFDEDAVKHIVVTLVPKKGGGIDLSIEDDGPGFKEVREIWTIYATGKQESPLKRGRLGRGLKELLSVCSSAEVFTAGKRVAFSWNGRAMLRTITARGPNEGRAESGGTLVRVSIPSWKAADIEQIQNYLRLFVPPAGMSMSVNGVTNHRPAVIESIDACLATVTFDNEGIAHTTYRNTKVLLYEGAKWIYELGIPVEEISEQDGFEWSLDVQQRVPLRPERDMLPRQYVRSIYAQVANAMLERLPKAELTDQWMEEAVGHHDFAEEKKKPYAKLRFGDNAARAIVADPHDRNRMAQEQGVNVIHTEHLSASVRELVRDVLPTTADLNPVGLAPARYVAEAEWTPGEKLFVAFARWLAGRMQLPVPEITIMEAPSASCQADSAASATRIRVNRSGLSSTFFSKPELRYWMPLIVHELAHRVGNGHDPVFYREAERLAGEACQVIAQNYGGAVTGTYGL